jgi:hypothetical protein
MTDTASVTHSPQGTVLTATTDSQLLMDTLQSMDTVDSNVVKTVQEIMDKCAPKAKAKPKASGRSAGPTGQSKASQSKTDSSQPSQSSHEPVITAQQQPVVVTLCQGQELHIHFDGNPKDSKILFIKNRN